jgi:hypothetical protein
MLSLVVTPDRAASIVGDLVEASPSGRAPWISVACIAISLLWKDVSARPGRMLYLATAGAVMNFMFVAPFGGVIFFLGIVFVELGVMLLHHDVEIAVHTLLVCLAPCVAIPVPFMTGRWIARRSPGKELAPCFVLTMLAFAMWSASALASGGRIAFMKGLSGVLPTLACLTVAALSLNAGAIWSRNHPGSVYRWFERVPFEECFFVFPKNLRDWFIPRDLEVQKVSDCATLLVLPILYVGFEFLPDSFALAIRIFFVLSLLICVIPGRPLQWIRPASRLVVVFGRLLFLGLAILLALNKF